MGHTRRIHDTYFQGSRWTHFCTQVLG
jgi:hypothetical protein